MFNKMLPLLGTAGLLVVTALCTSPVKAEPLDNPLLLSQLRGHETWNKEPQMDAGQYVVGRVRGTVGGILFVEFMNLVTVDGKSVMSTEATTGYTRIMNADAMGGDDVIFQVMTDDQGNKKLVYVGKAHPYWVSRLKLKSEAVSTSNTSQLIEELNKPSQAVGLPALAPETRTYTEAAPVPVPAPEPAAAPVRGLW